MSDLTQRLRELAEALEGCEWELPLCSRETCVRAADEIERFMRERDEAREAACFMYENAEDVAAGRCFGLMQAWPWLESEPAGGER